MESPEAQVPIKPADKSVPNGVAAENHKKRLAFFGDVLKLVRHRKTEGVDGKQATTSWTELYREVPPFESALELNNNVRTAVEGFVSSNFPQFREALDQRSRLRKYRSFKGIKEIGKMDDDALTESVVNNSFDNVPGSIAEDRRYVFLAEAAHVVKRVESYTTRKLIETASPQQLAALGLNENLRQLAVDLLEVSLKSDPMYLRMKSLGQFSDENGVVLDDGSTDAQIEKFALKVPGKDKPVTTADAFPKESGYLSKRFGQLAEQDAPWKTDASGQAYSAQDTAMFADYLKTLGNFYGEVDPKKAAEYYQAVQDKFTDLSKTNFPLLVLPPTESMDVIPYLDPELSVYTKSPESKVYEQSYDVAKQAMADSLGLVGEGKFRDAISKTSMNQYSTLGAYGINLTFRQAAQENPVGMIFLDEQLRQMSSSFPEYLDVVGNFESSSKVLENMDGNFPQFVDLLRKTEPRFDTLTNADKKQKYIEYMCTMTTVFHEFSHPIYLKNTPEGARMGNDALEVVDECKADSLYRGLIPSVIQNGGIEGTKELWADAMLAASLQVLHTGGEDDVYTKSNTYALKPLFEGKNPVVVVDGGKLRITDYDRYYDVMLQNGRGLLDQTYENSRTTPQIASEWLAKNTVPSKRLVSTKQLVEQLVA